MNCKEFLETIPPGRFVEVEDIFDISMQGVLRFRDVRAKFYCDDCANVVYFATDGNIMEAPISINGRFAILSFVCCNCRVAYKIVPLVCKIDRSDKSRSPRVQVRKIGEYPAFGGPIPSRIKKLFGSDSDLFVKARNSENQGFGIGAFAYYRQLVEKARNTFIDQLAQVAASIGTSPDVMVIFDEAKKERQFIKAFDMLRSAVPQSLYFAGQNPLLLLHDALSEDIHAGTDESALAIASDIRIVLMHLAERIGSWLDDQKELNNAVQRLSDRAKSKK